MQDFGDPLKRIAAIAADRNFERRIVLDLVLKCLSKLFDGHDRAIEHDLAIRVDFDNTFVGCSRQATHFTDTWHLDVDAAFGFTEFAADHMEYHLQKHNIDHRRQVDRDVFGFFATVGHGESRLVFVSTCQRRSDIGSLGVDYAARRLRERDPELSNASAEILSTTRWQSLSISFR